MGEADNNQQRFQGLHGPVEFTPQLMTQGWRVHEGWRGPALRVVFGLIAIAFVYAGGSFLVTERVLGGVILLACAAILFKYSLTGSFRVHRAFEKQYAQMGMDKEIVYFAATDEFLQLKTKEVELKLKWSELHKWKEDRNLILAYRHERLYQLIPTDQLPESVVQRIRSQLSQHVKKV